MKSIINGIKISQLLGLIVFISGFSSVNLFSMAMSEKAKILIKKRIERLKGGETKKKSLLIFLDDSEKKEVGPIGYELTIALDQEVGPIIVSTSLFNNTVNDEETLRWVDDRPGEKSYLKKGIKVFKSDQWIIKKINDLLNLLIPISYLESLNIDKERVKQFDNNIISDVELQLGLKVNHMETLDYQSMKKKVGQFTYANLGTHFLSYFYKFLAPKESEKLEFASYFINSLKDIFCEKFDYQKKSRDIPEWFIYISGHGSLMHSVAYLNFEDFNKFLYFLDSKINTKLLTISSCYSGGANVNKIYGELKLKTQKYFSFPIIIQALNNTAIFSLAPRVDMSAYIHNKIKLITDIDFINFFQKAKKMDGNYSEIIKFISPDFIQNTPQIKLPGIEWFSVIELDKKIVLIGSTLVKARDPQKSLDVVSFFKKEPKIILLYTDNIPFELVVNTLAVEYIISMVPPQIIKEIPMPVFMRIKKISSTQSFSDIIGWFKELIYTKGFTHFCIDEIGNKRDIIIFRTNDKCLRVYYRAKDSDIIFTKKLTEIEVVSMQRGLQEIAFDRVNKNSWVEKRYRELIRKRDEYLQNSEKGEEARKEISSEQIKKIKNVLQGKIEEQERQKEIVSNPPVD